MSSHVFLSHSMADVAVARAIANALESHNVKTWVDTASLQPGASWRDEISNALRKANVVIAIVSQQSLRSPWMHFEIGAAFSLGTPVVTVLVGEITPSDLPDWLQSVQYVDARGDSIQHVAEQVADQVLRIQAG